VLLTVEVLPDGTSGKIEIKESSGYRDLDRAAVTAIRRWRFTPAREGGIARPAMVEIPVVFTLRE
jgi:protein TonB